MSSDNPITDDSSSTNQQSSNSIQNAPLSISLLFQPDQVNNEKDRKIVQNQLISCVKQNDFDINQLYHVLKSFVNPIKRYPLTDLMTSLYWMTALLENTADAGLILYIGKTLEKIFLMPSSGNKQAERQKRVARAALRHTRHSVVRTLEMHKTCSKMIAQCLGDRVISSMIIIGIISSASFTLLAEDPSIQFTLRENKSAILQLYITIILASKTPLNDELAGSFSPFFHEIVDTKDFDTIVLPALSKALLRAPETVLISIVPSLIKSLSSSVDLSRATNDSLLPSLMSCFSSSNAKLREEAAKTAIELVSRHCLDESLLKKEIASKCTVQAKKATSSDQRAFYGKLLSAIPVREHTIAENIIDLLKKETNEHSLTELVTAFLRFIPRNEPITSKINETFKNIETKPPVQKRVWICSIVQNEPWILDQEKQVLSFMKKLYDAIEKSPFSAIQEKSISAAYAYLVATRTVTDFTFSADIYKRLNGNDLSWAIKAASVIPPNASKEWGKAWIYFCEKDGRSALPILGELYEKDDTKVGESLLSGMDPANQTGLSKIFETVFASTPNADIMAQCIVVAHHENAKPKHGWIGMCVKAGVDPGRVLKEHHEDLMNRLKDEFSFGSAEAAAQAFCSLAFIDSALVTPEIVGFLREWLSTNRKLTAEDLVIFNTPDNELAPLAKTDKILVENKNSKDYKEKQWEDSVRREIAAKRKPEKHQWTKEEKELLANEKARRQEIQSIKNRLMNGLLMIKSLSESEYSTGIEIWFSPAVELLLPLLKYPLVEKESSAVLLELSKKLSSRLDSTKHSLGQAVVKVCSGSTNQIDDLILRVLYRLKFLGDQRPLNTVTFVYSAPLLLNIIRKATNEEQILLTLEILSTHASQVSESGKFSMEIVTALIDMLSSGGTVTSRDKQVKETLLSISQNLSLFAPEELQPFLDGISRGDNFVRASLLEILSAEAEFSGENFPEPVYIALHDDDQVISDFAQEIWTENALEIDENTPLKLLKFIGANYKATRIACARAIAVSTSNFPGIFENVFSKTLEIYYDEIKPREPVYNKYGIPVESTKTDSEISEKRRHGVALTLENIAPLFKDESDVVKFFKFAVSDGSALSDSSHEVRAQMQIAGLAIIRFQGLKHIEALIPLMEEYLNRPDQQTNDSTRESVIIFYGSLAEHLPPDDERIAKIMESLLQTLSTPSEDIQYAVAQRIAPLINSVDPDHANDYISQMMSQLSSEANFAQRKGAAYGLAGLVKGLGIVSLADYDIVRNLAADAEDRSSPLKRQGSQFAFETLSLLLGKFFEPYVVEIMPLILACLGDGAPEVRSAAGDAAKQIMKSATAYGIKKLIPLALENIGLTAWRAKKGAVELLGTMAYLDPRQLSDFLSVIIPEIVNLLGDTHKEVRNAANSSLKKFGEVIRNPEVQKLVPTILNAISDPVKHTEQALDGLLKTEFVHYIDGPSLALVTYVLHRGLRDRSAATKRKACQIVGNMAILTDAKDILPYLSDLVNELEIAMVDPVPGTRAMASKALGSLVEKLGEEQFPALIPKLLDTLKDEKKAGDQLGSAQALAEVIHGLGLPKLEELLPQILQNCMSPKSWIRAGFMPLLLYLPACFGQSMSPYLHEIIPPILAGLADNSESVHDTALKAGRRLVQGYASKAVDLMLPELEKGLSNSNYRIRASSLDLTGDLLYQITGTSNEEEVQISTNINKTLLDVLGQERRDRVFALLFICRTDTSAQVRNAALEVWLSLVSNTPKTVKEILPILTQIIIKRLASNEDEQRRMAANALGELVKRAGGNALAQLLPTLKAGMEPGATDSDARQGICIALVSLINSTSSDVLDEYKPTVISIVKQALIDIDPKVREAAGQAFDALQEEGNAADDILPNLIELMKQGDARALDAAKEMMYTKSDVVFPLLIPALLEPPMTAFKATALGGLSSVSGKALYKRISTILSGLIHGIHELGDSDDAEKVSEAFDEVCLSVTHDDGTHLLMNHLHSLAYDDDVAIRRITLKHMAIFLSETVLNISSYTVDWTPIFVACLDNDRDPDMVQYGFDALTAILKRLSREEMHKLVKPTRQAIIQHTSNGPIAGFNSIPKGPMCVLPIFLNGLMYGSSSEREDAALAIGEIVDRCHADSLKPLVTQIVGPLIRTMGERFPSDVKAAILSSLDKLLSHVPQFLKPFLPQLQRTFIKSLSDTVSNDSMRASAAKALATLSTMTPRVDALVAELISSIRSTTDDTVIKAMTQALGEIIIKSGSKLSESSRNSLITYVLSDDQSSDIIIRAKMAGGLVKVSDETGAINLIKTVLNDENASIYGKVVAINAFLVFAGEQEAVKKCHEELLVFLLEHVTDEAPMISENCTVALGKILLLSSETTADDERILKQLAEVCQKSEGRSSNTRRLALVALRVVANLKREVIDRYLPILVLPVFACVRDTQIPVKLAAEKAYLALFSLVEDVPGAKFDSWLKAKGSSLPPMQQRQISEYTKRVALRLAAAERDRIAAGGDEVHSDRVEDEQEIWAIGSVTEMHDK